MRLISLASLSVALCCGAAPPPAAPAVDASATKAAASKTSASVAPKPTFQGQDRFDDIRDVASLQELEREVKHVAERARPSVVLLRTRGRSGAGATGTGVIIDKDGLVATCGHVGVRPGNPVTAVLSDGTELKGHALGQLFSGGIDCGLIKLETEGRELPTAPLGTTTGLAKGDWLVAMGYTHGPGEANRPSLVRVGRVLRNDEKELLFDAPIDAGDSGGPSFNLRGEVVGLNSRCGRQSWENVATPIDLLISRREELEGQDKAEEGGRGGPRGERGPSTNFPSGGSDAGKLAVQRRVRLTEVVENAQNSMVRVMDGDNAVSYGLIIDARGLVVTKASQLPAGTALEVETTDRERRSATEVSRDPASDVALLRVELSPGDVLHAAKWASDAPVSPGSVLVTPRAFPDNPAIGFSAIEVRESESDSMDAPYLGVESISAPAEDLADAGVEEAVIIRRVRPDTPAERAGLTAGDMVLSVQGQSVGTPAELRRVLMKQRAGDSIAIILHGEEGDRTLHATLGTRADSDRRIRRGNTITAISRLSSGLGPVLAHDTITTPEQMGGPVVDLEGHVVALNIARYDRTATHAIPAARMAEICGTLIEKARKARESAPSPAAN